MKCVCTCYKDVRRWTSLQVCSRRSAQCQNFQFYQTYFRHDVSVLSSFSPSCHFSFFASGSEEHQVHPSVVQFLFIFDHTCVSWCPFILSSPRLLCPFCSSLSFSLQPLLLISLPVTHPCLCLCYPSHFSSLAVFPPAHSSFQPEWPGDAAIIHLNLLTTRGPFRTSEEISPVLRDSSDETEPLCYLDV